MKADLLGPSASDFIVKVDEVASIFIAYSVYLLGTNASLTDWTVLCLKTPIFN